jgi:flagellar basal-body rod protein FlgC
MKINPNFSAFKISSQGMSIQKKKMELITENIANTSTTKTSDGQPYKRKFISVMQEKNKFQNLQQNSSLGINAGLSFNNIKQPVAGTGDNLENELVIKEELDQSEGELVYMPDHPDANEEGYVQMPNVSVVTEMVDMIAASRSFEANMTAFNAAKQMAKDSLEI